MNMKIAQYLYDTRHYILRESYAKILCKDFDKKIERVITAPHCKITTSLTAHALTNQQYLSLA